MSAKSVADSIRRIKRLPKRRLELSQSLGSIDRTNTANDRTQRSASRVRHGVGPARATELELEVLKAVMAREAYLERLQRQAKGMTKRFQDEVADTFDLLRLATVEVVEAVVAWREVVGPDAEFQWNSVNYLLKIPSDLDYLDSHRVLRKWLGFPISRNPFVIPWPAEHFLPSSSPLTYFPSQTIGSSARDRATNNTWQPSQLSRKVSTLRSQSADGQRSDVYPDSFGYEGEGSEMHRIRRAEQVVLREEERHGRYGRDRAGNLTIAVVADANVREHELNADNFKQLSLGQKASTTHQFAPMAELARVGYNTSNSKHGQSPYKNPPESSPPRQPRTRKPNSRYPGALVQMPARGVEGRMHEPLLSTASSQVQIARARTMQAAQQRLADIAALREKIEEEQEAVARLQLLVGDSSVGGCSDECSTARSEFSGAPMLDEADRQHAEFELDERAQRMEEMQAKLAAEEEEARKVQAQVESRERKWAAMQAKQRADQQAHAAGQIEAQRRLLERVQAKRVIVGHSIEDIGAIEIQRYTRGYFARQRIQRYLRESGKVIVGIQAVARGYIARQKLARHFREGAAATVLQQFWRSVLARAALRVLKHAQQFEDAATCIQKAWRGCLGRQRALAKKHLDRSAMNAMECVGVRALFVSDLKDLAARIWASVDASQRKPFLPDEVLWLIRIVLAVLLSQSVPDEQPKTFDIVAYDTNSSRIREQMQVEHLTWEAASKILNRSNRLLRMLRSFTAVAALRPSMYLHISASARALYTSIRNDYGWADTVFSGIGVGSKCTSHLFKWVTAIFQIHAIQDQFLDMLSLGEPEWLEDLRTLQNAQTKQEAIIRMCGFERSVLEQLQTGDGMSAAVPHIEDHDVFNKTKLQHQAEIAAHFEAKAAEAEAAKRQLAVLQHEEQHLCSSRKALETRSLAELNTTHAYVAGQLQDAANIYHAKVQRAQQQGSKPGEDIHELRTKLLEQETALQAIESKRQLVRLEHRHNAHLRQFKAAVSPEIGMVIKEIAESRALQFYLQLQKREVLAAASVTDVKHLPEASLEIFEDLGKKLTEAADTEQRLTQSWQLHELRYEEMLNREVLRHRSLMDAYKEHDLYSEQEREEDRREDEAAAALEVVLARQFVNPELLQQKPAPKRPVLLAMSRDISRHAKDEIIHSVRSALSGQFVVLDGTASRGLHIPDIQQVFDTGQNVIAFVDIGLTSGTRQQFLDAVELASAALVPSPTCMLLAGDSEDSCASPEGGCEKFGVSELDLESMADGPAKQHMQTMSHCLRLLLLQARKVTVSIPNQASVPTSFRIGEVLVTEAIGVICNSDGTAHLPGAYMGAITWQAVEAYLQEPKVIVDELRRYGNSREYNPLKYDVVRQYSEHTNWPSVETIQEPIVRSLHTFCTAWLGYWTWVRAGGGLPAELTRNHMRGLFASVLQVSDSKQLGTNKRTSKHVLSMLIKGILEDLVVYKAIHRIDAELFRTTVCRSEDRIFFCSYEPFSSSAYFAHITTDKVSELLAPSPQNAQSLEAPVLPPQTVEEIYSRLVALLHFEEAHREDSTSRQLVCRRQYQKLGRFSCKVNGHLALLTAYESAFGSVRFAAYLPAISDLLVAVFEKEDFAKLRADAHPTEQALTMSEITPDLLKFLLDRLQITPSRPHYAERKREIAAPQIRMAVRYHGGPGRLLHRGCIVWGGAVLILQLRICSLSASLRVIFYDPQSSAKTEVELSSLQRQLLLSDTSQDWRAWWPRLKGRLRMYNHWDSSEMQLQLRTDVASTVMVGSDGDRSRQLLSLHISNDNRYSLEIQNPTTGTAQQLELSNADVEQLHPAFIPLKPTTTEAIALLRVAATLIEHDQTTGQASLQLVDTSRAFAPVEAPKWASRPGIPTTRQYIEDDTTEAMAVVLRRCQPIVVKITQNTAPEEITRVKGRRSSSTAEELDPAIPPSHEILENTDLLLDAANSSPSPSPSPLPLSRGARTVTPRKAGPTQVEQQDLPPVEGDEPAAMTEKLVFSKVLKVAHRQGLDLWRERVSIQAFMQYVFLEGTKGRQIRLQIYSPTTAKSCFAVLAGEGQLRMVLGIHAQDLIAEEKQVDMIEHIALQRLTIDVPEDADGELSASCATERLYTEDKVTPLPHGDEIDKEFNADKIIVNSDRRGRKLLRTVKRIAGVLMHLVVFEMDDPNNRKSLVEGKEGNDDDDDVDESRLSEPKSGFPSSKPLVAPMFRILGYDPRTGKKAVATASPDIIMDLCGTPYAPQLLRANRKDLARMVCDHVQADFGVENVFRLFVQWSGQKIAQQKQQAVADVSSESRKLFRTAIRVGKLDLVVTITTDESSRDAIQVTVYSTRLSISSSFVVEALQQQDRLGKTLVQFSDGEPRATAARKLCKLLDVKELVEDGQSYLEAQLLPPERSWLPDYQAAGRTDAGRRIGRAGYPEVPLPHDNRGRLIGRKGVDIDEHQYIVSIFEKAKEVAVEHGVRLEIYRIADSANCVLHIGPQEVGTRMRSNEFLKVVSRLPAVFNTPDPLLVNKQGVPIEALEEEVVQTAQPNKTRAVVELLLRDLTIELPSENEIFAKLNRSL